MRMEVQIKKGDTVIFTTYNKPAKVLKIEGDHAWIRLLKKEPLINDLFVLTNQLKLSHTL